MIYLDNASTSFPKPQSVYDGILKSMKEFGAAPGRNAHSMAVRASDKIQETRQRLNDLVKGYSESCIVFTSSATEALNIGIKGLLQPGDHVISTEAEHNSVLRPLKSLNASGVRVSLVKTDLNGYICIDDIKKEIRKNTRAVVINHASNVTGVVQDIKSIGKLAEELGLVMVVDASQSIGTIEFDVQDANIGILAFSGHKGLFGPQGTGAMYIRPDILLQSYKDGATESGPQSMIQPQFLPDRFESGMMNIPGIAGLCEGLKFIKDIGIDKIRQHECLLMEYLIKELKKLSRVKLYGENKTFDRAAVLSMNIEGIESSFVGHELDKKGIAVRTGFLDAPLIHGILGTDHCGLVRLSPGYFNSFEDIEKTIQAITEICNK